MSLQDLPPELFERIVVLLSLPVIGSLRLGNRCLASKSTQDHFKAFFVTKSVEITEHRLEAFASITADDGLGSLLQTLTVINPVYNTLELAARLEDNIIRVAEVDDGGNFIELGEKELSEGELQGTKRDLNLLQQRRSEQLQSQQSGKLIRLLSQSLSNLASHGVVLCGIRLEVGVYRDDALTSLPPLYGGSWKYIWAATATLTHSVFASLAVSGLPIESINIFNSDRMLQCSLACNELGNTSYTSAALCSSLAHLVVLSLSISDTMVAQRADDFARSEDTRSPSNLSQRREYRPRDEVLEDAIDPANFTGLRNLLQACTSLAVLELVRYSLGFVDNRISPAHCRGILQVLVSTNLSCLREITLGGFDADERDLLDALQRCKSLQSLGLRCITLLSGTFRSILDYCTVQVRLETAELDSLFEPGMSFSSRHGLWTLALRPTDMRVIRG